MRRQNKSFGRPIWIVTIRHDRRDGPDPVYISAGNAREAREFCCLMYANKANWPGFRVASVKRDMGDY